MSAAELAKSDGARPLSPPTVWGLDPTHVHDRFWAARGLQVVRQGEPSEIVPGAELYLLTDPRSLVLFPILDLVETLSWLTPELLFLRLRVDREAGYREEVRTGEDGEYLEIQRLYRTKDSRQARVGLTPDLSLAREWQSAEDPRSGWITLRELAQEDRRAARAVAGRHYHRNDDREVMDCITRIVEIWNRPDAAVERVTRARPEVWADESAVIPPATRFLGPVWVGAGRKLDEDAVVAGPAVIWDAPDCRPSEAAVRWQEIELLPQSRRVRRQKPAAPVGELARRLFDIAFSLIAILVTLPIYPLVIIAILLEDGWPVFFAHQRETLGGRDFPCMKFRSMRKDAEEIKKRLAAENQADGPQFFIKDDPRLSRVGRFIRKTQIDELPQFFNVLIGHMSVVGPRPSPYHENQYSPGWREARLSVKPGITGLWQVKRTRQEGLDFQEWIRFDLEYVRKRTFPLDLLIIGKTVLLLLTGRASR